VVNMHQAGKALLGFALRGENIPDEFLSSFAQKASVGKLVTRDSVKLRKEQEENSKHEARKVSFSASGSSNAMPSEITSDRKVSWSSARTSLRAPPPQEEYVNDSDDSVASSEYEDDFEAEEGLSVPRARIGSISKAARRSSLEVAKERKDSKLGLDVSAFNEEVRRKSSFAKGDSRRKVSWNGSAQQRSILDIPQAAKDDIEAPEVDGTIDEAARRSSLTLAKKRKSSLKAKQAELARQGVTASQGTERVLEEGRLFASGVEGDAGTEDGYKALSFVFPDGSDEFMLYDPARGPRDPTLKLSLTSKHMVTGISHLEVAPGINANCFSVNLNGTKTIVELASPDSALIAELHTRVIAVIQAKAAAPAKRGGMSVLFGSQ